MSSDLEPASKALVEEACARAAEIVAGPEGLTAEVDAAKKALDDVIAANAANQAASAEAHAEKVAAAKAEFMAAEANHKAAVAAAETARAQAFSDHLSKLRQAEEDKPSKRVRRPAVRQDPQTGANTEAAYRAHQQQQQAEPRSIGAEDLESQARAFANAAHPLPDAMEQEFQPPELSPPQLLPTGDLEQELAAAESRLHEKRAALGGCVTAEDFMAHAKTVVKPGFEYYRDLFERTGKRDGKGKELGELKTLKEAFLAARVFDPLELGGMTAAQGEQCIDELVKFGFPEFKQESFISDLKDELAAAIDAANTIDSFDWDKIPGCAEYDKQVSTTAATESTAIVREVSPQSWQDDPIERARRIWEWWKLRWDTLPAWKKALRLVVLVQPSSAAAERVFSQLKHIVDACGESMLAETLLYRMLRRCNAGVY